MDVHTPLDLSADCHGVNEVLSRIGDKWTVLRDQPRRFNDIKRQVSGISQQMLTRTLKALERDGMVERTVRATTPPQVEYSLTTLGQSLSEPLRQLAEWALAHRETIREKRLRYDASC